MSESPSSAATNAAEFTVSEISGALKRAVEDAFGNVRVRGEISGYRGPHSSGHAYFALKDDRARIEAVVWKTTFARLRFRPEEGMEVVAQGKLTTYPGTSKYQIVIDSLEPAGAGALMALLEDRKRRLAAEGLFETDRKRRLPYMPRVIGVVTSPTGAVIRDIIHRIADRFPLHLVVWPVRVQGETTGAEVSAAVAGFNSLPAGGAIARPDVIIVARGGGSLEDLWGFNDEAVVRAVAASSIPVISAVGHETDWTLIDLAADMRAPTPTGAAELAVPVRADLEAGLAQCGSRLAGSVRRAAERRRETFRACARAMPSADDLLAMPRRRFDEAAGRLERALETGTYRKRARLDAARLSPAVLAHRFAEARGRLVQRSAGLDACIDRRLDRLAATFHRSELRLRPETIRDRLAVRIQRLAQAERLLNSVSYQSVLQRGFVLVKDQAGHVVRRAASVAAGDALVLQFGDGAVAATATGSDPVVSPAAPAASAPPAPRAPRQPKARGSGEQGSLF